MRVCGPLVCGRMEEAPEDERLAASGDGMGVDRRNLWLMRHSCVCQAPACVASRMSWSAPLSAAASSGRALVVDGVKRTALEREAVRDAWVARVSRLRAGGLGGILIDFVLLGVRKKTLAARLTTVIHTTAS